MTSGERVTSGEPVTGDVARSEARILRNARRAMTIRFGYPVCGHVLGWAPDRAPVICAMPRRHDSPHLPAH